MKTIWQITQRIFWLEDNGYKRYSAYFHEHQRLESELKSHPQLELYLSEDS